MNLGPHKKLLLVAVVIGILALAVRLPGAGTFMTADEENWMIRSASFWQAILAVEFDRTFLTTHPGSTVMWLAGAGETIQERRLGLTVHESNLLHFRKAAIYPLLLASVVLLGIITGLLGLLIGRATAVAAGLLLAVDPYLVGMTQIVHLDGLQGLLMLASLLAFAAWLRWDTIRYGILAGVLWGLALGVKLALAIWLGPVFAGILLFHFRSSLRQSWPRVVSRLGFATGIAALLFFGLWPTLWVKDDSSRSIVRDIRTVVTDEHVALSAGGGIAPASFYIRTVAARVPPHVHILVLGSLVWAAGRLFHRNRSRVMRGDLPIVWLLIYAAGFLVLITLAAKKADRYALPALVVFPVVAGWGAVQALLVIERHWPSAYKRLSPALALLGAAVAMLPLLWSPHAIAYNNPLFQAVRPLSQQGWGEGLEAVAGWLAAQPLGEHAVAASWYAPVLNTYYNGDVLDLRYRNNYRVKYIVTYRNMYGRGPNSLAAEVLREVAGQAPAHVVTIQGVPYAWVYETDNIGYTTQHVGELVAGMRVGQTVAPAAGHWQAVEIAFATFSERENTADVVVHIKQSPSATADIRTVRARAVELPDNAWHRFAFESIAVDPGEQFYIEVESPDGRPGNAVTVRYAEQDILPGQMYLGRPAGELATMPQHDVAYRTITENL